MALEEILEKHIAYEASPDVELVKKAYSLAEVAHMGQKRLSGEEQIEHCLAVADILTTIKADSVTLTVALLHDVLAETDLDKETLALEFTEEIASLVSGLTAVKRVSDKASLHAFGDREDLRHLILATVKDPRILAVRLAEKVHSLQTAKVLEREKQKVAAQKVLEIWAPLAGVMGLYRFKNGLEDLAFGVLYPKEYKEVKKLVEREGHRMKKAIAEVKTRLTSELAKEKIPVRMTSRTKHLFGVYKKLPKYKSVASGKLYDVLGLRVIVRDIEECYRVLDVTRRLWEEEPALFDDYIANPKPNGYQSLHTVFFAGGQMVEIQIRAESMHAAAEYGLAAHPIYKEGKVTSEERIALIRNLVLWEKGKELELFPDKVFVFTPKGDVKVLPQGATPVDFAYAVHTKVGDECSSAEVDGKIAPLDGELKAGEVVRIITKKGKTPSSDWLRFAKTALARVNIEKALKVKENAA
ncbi:HD domain-containing protein [Candidatus Saccharibacteria bacterium]|nr:HD domain-containing protein [Candidatus Saccharibacteria bacterium]